MLSVAGETSALGGCVRAFSLGGLWHLLCWSEVASVLESMCFASVLPAPSPL